MSNLEERVRKASMYKFMSQGEAYFPQMHTTASSFEQLQNDAGKLVEGTFVMVIDKITEPRLMVPWFRLVECIVFEGEWYYMTLIKDNRAGFQIDLVPEESPPPVTSISLSLICTDNQPYPQHLQNSVAHYREVLADYDHEICVAWFGHGVGLKLGDDVRVVNHNVEKFHMAYARNRSLGICVKSHVLMIDLDAYLSKEQLAGLVEAIPQTHGVINFCKPTHPFKGNGLYFGERTKLVANGHHEGFQKFYFEDTEFLMNLSRIGVVPSCHFVDFDFVDDHYRGATRGWFPHNQKMFETILKQGHR